MSDPYKTTDMCQQCNENLTKILLLESELKSYRNKEQKHKSVIHKRIINIGLSLASIISFYFLLVFGGWVFQAKNVWEFPNTLFVVLIGIGFFFVVVWIIGKTIGWKLNKMEIKQQKFDVDQLFLEWKCLGCKEKGEISIADIGNPYCVECDMVCELSKTATTKSIK